MSTINIYDLYHIDKSRLSRDYITYPLQLIKKYNASNKPYKEYEYLPKDDLYYLYITCRLSTTILAKELFHIKSTVLSHQLQYYNINKTKTQIQNDRRYTNTLKYGVENVMQLQKFKEQMYKTNYLKYGCKSSIQNHQVLQKRNHNNLIKYGVENVMQVKDIQKKKNMTEFQRYGYNTIVHNSISQEEQRCFQQLQLKFPDAIQQYYDEKRYPFYCDMYIPSLDLFIEYQGFGGGHNNRPYQGTEEDKKELQEHQLKAMNGNSMSLRIINVWFNNDIRKRQIAKNNDIRLLEFFSECEFMQWLEEQ